MLRISGTGYHDDSPLQIPAQDDLCRGNVVVRSDCPDGLISQQRGGISSAAQRVPALDNDPFFLNEGDHVLFLIIRMNLILNQSRHDRNLWEKFRQFFHIPV